MIVSLIAALDESQGIGLNNRLPWHLSADLKRFKELTLGHHLIVGRKTFESIGRSLPGRKMIVVTHDPHYRVEGVEAARSLETAIQIAEKEGDSEVFIAGGAEIFALALPLASRIYLTRVHTQTGANTFFPQFNPSEWKEKAITFHEADEKNEYPFTFSILERFQE